MKLINFEDIVKEQFYFPDGTYHCKIDGMKLLDGPHVFITSRFEPMKIATQVDAIRSNSQIGKRCFITLKIPYIPAARQDRRCDYGEPFTAKVYANFLNSLDVDCILTLEPHSDVLPALLDKAHSFYLEDVMRWDDILDKSSDVIFVSPDGGAIKRTHRIIKHLDKEGYTNSMYLGALFADKYRDSVTGKIEKIDVNVMSLFGEARIGTRLNPDSQYIVVDDVGAMCGTFLGLHDELVKHGAKHIDICLAHMDCNRNGLVDLCDKYDNVYITNSQSDYCSGGNLTVVDVL